MPDDSLRRAKTARPRSSGRVREGSNTGRRRGSFPIVGIGASAGGLEACKKLLAALPAGNGMAFVLVQHLDPSHDSMMADLLAGYTSMPVQQAADGMPLECEHLYLIPPGTYLSIGGGSLHLSAPRARHGARLPFDFLLHSLAKECGESAICIILSGTGADGSLGLEAVKMEGGLVIAQEPAEAGFDGMPRSAIMTGTVDLVLPAAEMPAAIARYNRQLIRISVGESRKTREPARTRVDEIIAFLRTQTGYDFSPYKIGTLQRRIERRMVMAGIGPDGTDRYLAHLRSDAREPALLAKDLRIGVTSFFRDSKAFDVLAERVIPELIRCHKPERQLRVWVAGCSTGEEAYSLAILLREQISAAGRHLRLQIFASDIDPDAVATARDGLYPHTIEADVSSARLAQFFRKEDHGYRIVPDLRASVVFTLHDVLVDPPFSQLDLVSCRNLLIYFRPETQEKVLSLFHFALRDGGVLLLGRAETAGNIADRFEPMLEAGHAYHRIGRHRPEPRGLPMSGVEPVRLPARLERGAAPSRQAALADLCRRLVLEDHAPAAVLINRRFECLFSLGPIDRYLRLPAGHPSQDLLAMAREGTRTELRLAVEQSWQDNMPVVVPGGRLSPQGDRGSFRITVEPVLSEGEELSLICFVEGPEPDLGSRQQHVAAQPDAPRVAELEQDLRVTRLELRAAIRDLATSGDEQKAINQEALSINEEFQSVNEELLTSKEELQSLNEELNALNGQLQETLERQRTTSNDLQNVLYSTDIATLFLDTHLDIRFFTPATRALFNVIPGDLGRPLADLNLLAVDRALLADARAVLQNLAPLECEVETEGDIWFMRRVLPYRAHDDVVEGVVVTFTDITERKRAGKALEAAKLEAELANAAKSRFLAAASHDLRQPLQTLTLLQGLLAKSVKGESVQDLVARIGQTMEAMSGMLNTLLDINQIEAGIVRAVPVTFRLDDVLVQMKREFAFQAQAQGLDLRVVLSGLAVHSDPRLLEQMIRNLLSNALKYTERGKILLGCRRRAGMLSIEIWDTGIGIPSDALQAIFEEYHQLDNAARERSRGLGLGLSIVRRLGDLLGYPIRVHSRLGEGSVFAIEIRLAPTAETPQPDHPRGGTDAGTHEEVRRSGAILVVEDDPEVRDLLEVSLRQDGYHTAAAPDGIAALALVAGGTIRPDLMLADYNLPSGLNGLQLAVKLREQLGLDIPVIILTGDISTETLRNISRQDFVQLTKPVKLEEMTRIIRRLLARPHVAPVASTSHRADAAGGVEPPIIFVVDDNSGVREAVRRVLEDDGRVVEDYPTCEAFLESYRPGRGACLLIDAYLPGMSGLELLRQLSDRDHRLPAIMITGKSDVQMAVQAMKAGASDFIEKPICRDELLASIEHALEQSHDLSRVSARRERAARHLADLTARQRQVMDLVLAGQPSKNIAADLGISQRTVENHRASIMRKTGSGSLPALARLVLTAASNGADVPSRRDE